MVGDCCLSKFFWQSVDKNKLMCFQSEASIFKFLRHGSVDGKALCESCLSEGQAGFQVFLSPVTIQCMKYMSSTSLVSESDPGHLQWAPDHGILAVRHLHGLLQASGSNE